MRSGSASRGRVEILPVALKEVAAPRRHGTEEHHALHVFRMRDRIRGGEQWPVRMRHERDALDLEVLPQLVEILHLARGDERHRIRGKRRFSAATLVVEDHGVTIAEHFEIAEDRFVIDAGAAVDRDDRVGRVADDSIVEPGRVGGRDEPRLRQER